MVYAIFLCLVSIAVTPFVSSNSINIDGTFTPTESVPNNAPTISCEYIVNNSVDAPVNVTLRVCVNDTEGDSLTVNWYENSTDSWVLQQTNNTVTANSTVTCQSSGFFNTISTQYWWNVTAFDGTTNVSSLFTFTTHSMTTSGDILLNISGFSSYQCVNVYKNDILYLIATADVNGFITFYTDGDENEHFTFYAID